TSSMRWVFSFAWAIRRILAYPPIAVGAGNEGRSSFLHPAARPPERDPLGEPPERDDGRAERDDQGRQEPQPPALGEHDGLRVGDPVAGAAQPRDRRGDPPAAGPDRPRRGG